MRRDFYLLIVTRLLRSFAFGYGAILLGLYLESRGLTPAAIGLTLTLTLVVASLASLASAAASRWIGRRRTLAVSGLLMLLAGLGLAYATHPLLLILTSLTGMVSSGNIDIGPFASVEQAVLTETSKAARRNRAFARYSMTGELAAAFGGFAAGIGTSPGRMHGFWVLYAAIGVLTTVIPLLISSRVEGEASAPVFATTRRLVGLTALFALDSVGGGFVLRAVVTYWLHIRFGVEAQTLGPAFGAITLLAALSNEPAGWLSDRIGLINTMVFTHLPSNLFLMAVPFSPSLAVAIALLLLNGLLAEMDVPARQAYLVSIVKPSERAGAVAIAALVRGMGQSAGPVLAGLAIQFTAFGLPFLVGGGLKVVYDLSLYRAFHGKRADHEVELKSR